MSQQDEELYRTLLRNLEQKYTTGELTTEEYRKLKQKYLQKLRALQASSSSEPVGSSFPSPSSSSSTFRSAISRISTQHQGDRTILGFGKLQGAVYRNIRVAGALDIDGNLLVRSLKVAGAVSIQGSLLAAQSVKVAGSIEIEGSLESTDIRLDGSAEIKGKLKAYRFLKTSGFLSVSEDIECGSHLKLCGELSIEGSVLSADKLMFCDAFGVIKEDVAAETIDINMVPVNLEHSRSVHSPVFSSSSFSFSFSSPRSSRSQFTHPRTPLLIHGSVVGTHVSLQNVNIKGDVAADTLIIGKNVRIQSTVTYHDSLVLDPTAHLHHPPHRSSSLSS